MLSKDFKCKWSLLFVNTSGIFTVVLVHPILSVFYSSYASFIAAKSIIRPLSVRPEARNITLKRIPVLVNSDSGLDGEINGTIHQKVENMRRVYQKMCIYLPQCKSYYRFKFVSCV